MKKLILCSLLSIFIMSNVIINNLSASCRITSSGKDIYVEATGELITSLLVNGIIELYRQDVTLSGYCYAIR